MKKEESSPKSSVSSMHTAHLHHEIELDQNSGENITQSAYGSPAPEVEGKSIRTDDFRGKLPGLVDLTVPSSPGFPTDLLNDSWIGNTSEDDSSGSGSPEANTLLKGKPFPTFTRLKTRLQDAPSLTPAVKSQLTYCSSLTSRRGSFKSNSEEQTSAVDCGPTNNSLSQLTDQTASTQRNSSLGHISSNLKLNTNLLANGEEDKDPFDDDFIPDHKKGKESKWLMAIQWFSLFILVALLVCTVKIYILEKVTFVGLNLWRWQALALVIFCGQLMSGWIMKLFVSLIEKHYLLKKRVLYFVYGLRNSVKNCIWLALVLGVWEVIFQGHEDTPAVNIMTKILWCLFTASISWMLKVLAVKVAANSFHRTAYFDRIQECLFNQYLLERLSGPAIHGNDNTQDCREKSTTSHVKDSSELLMNDRAAIQKKLSKVDELPKGSFQSKIKGLWWRGNRNIQRQNDTSSVHDRSCRVDSNEEKGNLEKLQHNVIDMGCMTPQVSMRRPGKNRLPPQVANNTSTNPIHQDKLQELTSDTVSVWTLRRLMKLIKNTNVNTYSSMLSYENVNPVINSEVQARRVSKKIFQNMVKHGEKCIMLKNFMYFLPEEQAARAFSMFDTTETGEITKKSFMKWVVNVYKERRALCLTLNDNKTVVEKLHKVLNGVLVAILVAISILIFGVDTSKLLLFFSSIIVPSVFVFGNAAKNTFESLVFLFIAHPFDVGDRIGIDGQTMLVEEINVLNTILLSSSNEKVYFPNSLLLTKSIANYYRSPDQWDAIEFHIYMRTPVEKLAVLKERLQRYIEGLPEFWYPDFRIVCKDIEDCTRMKMAVWIRHRINFQEGGERFQRKSNMLLYLKQQLEDLDVGGYQLPQQE